jgi:thioredoxin-like negative regulator of GroEL
MFKRYGMPLTLMALMTLVLCSCDQMESRVETGQSAVDQAREVVGADADRKIDLARQLIQAGRAEEARRILQPLAADEASLPETTRIKLAAALEELP